MFGRTIAAFAVTFAILGGVLAVSLSTGYTRSLAAWSSTRLETLEDAARSVLSARRSGTIDQAYHLPTDIPIFIYDENRVLVASNRGIGRRRDEEGVELIPVTSMGETIGYFAAGTAHFRSDAANTALLDSLIRAALFGAIAALGAASVSAVILSRTLANPAAVVASGIDRFARGELKYRIPVRGTREVTKIARAANLMAERLSDERALRGQWAQDITHDLRTPIASIRARIEALSDGVVQPNGRLFTSLLAELDRVENLIEGLEELTRLEEPEIEPTFAPFCARSFVENLVNRFDAQARDRGLTITTQIGTDTIAGDENLLYRAVSNVLGNAVRYAERNGKVDVTVRGDDEGSLIVVANTGPVIPEDEIGHVFDRLFRGEYGRNSPGSGLGLTIAQRIVALHRGSIGMTSSREDGTSVTIRLPGSVFEE